MDITNIISFCWHCIQQPLLHPTAPGTFNPKGVGIHPVRYHFCASWNTSLLLPAGYLHRIQGASQKYAEKCCHPTAIIDRDLIFYQNIFVQAITIYASFHASALNGVDFVVAMVTL